jgi:putative ubiquitin-RnfH superfamily antitoxin RatB of RatAB toxin-antitoxin module
MAESIAVKVVYAQADAVWVKTLELAPSATVADALTASGLEQACPELELDRAPVGIFGCKVGRDRVLREGDRVEIYRPLQLDPMQARRRRAGTKPT